MDPTPRPTRSVADLRLPVGGLAAWLTVIATLALPASAGIAAGIVALVGAVAAAASRRAPAATMTLILGCAGAQRLRIIGHDQVRGDTRPLAGQRREG